MADSQLILELLFLQRQGGCSLTVLLFFMMLVSIKCRIVTEGLTEIYTQMQLHVIGCA